MSTWQFCILMGGMSLIIANQERDLSPEWSMYYRVFGLLCCGFGIMSILTGIE